MTWFAWTFAQKGWTFNLCNNYFGIPEGNDYTTSTRKLTMSPNWYFIQYILLNIGAFISPRGTISFLAVCLSVRPSVCPSVSPLVVRTLGFQKFSQSFLRYWLDSGYIDLSWHNTDQVWLYMLSRLTYFRHVIQFKFIFCRFWLTFNWVIALCKNLPFRTFLSRCFWYTLEIWYMNLSWHNSDQVWLLLLLT